MTVAALNKPRLVECSHCDPGKSCKIYARRPDECARFNCQYLIDTNLGEEWRPSHSGMLIAYDDEANRISICVDPQRSGIWRREPYYSRIKSMALAMLNRRGHLIVFEGRDGVAILPHKEVAIGPPRPDHVVVAGRRVNEQGEEEFDLAVLHRDDPRLKPQA